MQKIDLFILTEEWQDVNGRTVLRYRGITSSGNIEIMVTNTFPVLFIRRDNTLEGLNLFCKRKQVALKNFYGDPLDALYFNTQTDLKRADELLTQNNITTYEADIDPARRYLMEKGIFAQATAEGEVQEVSGRRRMINPKLIPAIVEPEISVLSLDIETGQDKSLYAIGVHLTGKGIDEKKVFMLDRESHQVSEKPEPYEVNRTSRFILERLPDQSILIQNFIKWIKEKDPDVIIGWHIAGFDLAFLDRKARELGIGFDISRGGGRVSIYTGKGGRNYADISGRVVIDGPTGLRTAFYNFEDYRLETVAQELVGHGKTITTDKDKVAEIERMFREDKETLAEYNIMDAILVTEIFEKTGLIKQYIKRSQLSGLPIDKLAMMTAAFDHCYLPDLHKYGFAAPNVRDIIPSEPAQGGHVLDPVPGIYENVIVLDFKSLYPTIIQTFRIDPISLLNNNVDTIITPAGFKFSYSKNYLPKFIGELMKQRSEAKKRGDTHLSQAIKILMNSFYGVMGSTGCRFYHPDLPSAITSTGQWLLLNSRDYLEERGYKVLYGDTDSLFVKIKDEEAGDPFSNGERIAVDMNVYWTDRLLREYKVQSYVEIEFEKYYRKFILTPARGSETGAKKRYAGLLVKNGKEEIEFTGMEIVRSDWTPLAKEFQAELYNRIFKEEEYKEWMNELVNKLKKGELDNKLVYTKRLRKESEDYIKNVPPQVKAARMLDTRSSRIQYVITKKGPIPLELNPVNIDYNHYIEKQLQPIADSVLCLLGESFDGIIQPNQLSMF